MAKGQYKFKYIGDFEPNLYKSGKYQLAFKFTSSYVKTKGNPSLKQQVHAFLQ